MLDGFGLVGRVNLDDVIGAFTLVLQNLDGLIRITWGNDTVEQMIGGNTLLWFYGAAREDLFLTADANGDAVLSCGDDTVTILNVKHDDVSAAFASGENQLLMGVSLRFGDDDSEQYTDLLVAGAFDGFTSEKIFEDRNNAMLA